jgi:hypothetical protein
MADLGRPASIRDEVKPWRMLATRAIHLGDQWGGSGSSACRGWVAAGVYRLPHLAQTVTGDDVLLTEAEIGRMRRAEALPLTSGGGSRYCARERVVAGVPRAC